MDIKESIESEPVLIERTTSTICNQFPELATKSNTANRSAQNYLRTNCNHLGFS